MKGIVLAGGLGKRMLPLTEIDNKHLLPVGARRMVELPISSLASAGIDEVVLIAGGQRAGAFLELLKNGRHLGLKRLYYTYQEGSGGIVEALKLAEPFVDHGEPCAVILGDNYFEESLAPYVQGWDGHGAGVLYTTSSRPSDFGVIQTDGSRVISLEEKPTRPLSNLIVPGLYFFDYSVWRLAHQVERASSGELEIVDLLQIYRGADQLTCQEYSGYWSDMGTINSWTEVIRRRA
tara:strand:- start:8696 stop:9400 length:705 start_codon:yes stop_codon:yes gene_type:complete